MTKPLRELTQKDVEWTWDQPQKQALDNLKRAVTNTPVLRYYNLDDEVTIQCDASQSGLGAALMQNGQPVAYASRALTPAEIRYAQIEKKLLAIVFACERFEAYIYGRQIIRVKTDHQPLELIVKKPLNSAPIRLQRMLLRLQRYCLDVTYKKGKQNVPCGHTQPCVSDRDTRMWYIKGLGECRSHFVTRHHERTTSADSVCIDR